MRFYFNMANIFNKIVFHSYILLMKKYKPGFTIGVNFISFGLPIFQVAKDASLTIGNNLVLNNHTNHNMVGLYKKCSFAVLEGAKLHIGDNCGFSGVSIYCTSEIRIGNNITCGGNVNIWDTDFHPLDYKARRINDPKHIKHAPIFIGNDVFIGGNSIILKGTTIGDRVIIGAGSVVTKNVPHDEIWAGNPAKFIRNINNETESDTDYRIRK